MPQAEQQSVCQLAHFFCGLHSLAHMAETAEATIKRIEDDILPTTAAEQGGLYKRSEASTIRLVRTCSKAFAAGADEKSGVYGHFIIFVKPLLEKNGMRSLPIVPFCGSRFNILFMNAASPFFLHRDAAFPMRIWSRKQTHKVGLERSSGAEAPNFMQSPGACRKASDGTAVVHAGEQGGSHFVYEQKVPTAASVLHHSDRPHDKSSWRAGICLLEPIPTSTVTVYQILMDDTEYDPTTEVYLRVMFPAMAVLCRRMFADHLSGGTHSHRQFRPSCS